MSAVFIFSVHATDVPVSLFPPTLMNYKIICAIYFFSPWMPAPVAGTSRSTLIHYTILTMSYTDVDSEVMEVWNRLDST